MIESGAQVVIRQMKEVGLVQPRTRFLGPDGLLQEELLKGATCDAALATDMRITFAGLPFETGVARVDVRDERINAGVWGTAAFPSVYRTDVHPFAFLPHSVRWQIVSYVLAIAGVIGFSVGGLPWVSALLLGTGAIGVRDTRDIDDESALVAEAALTHLT